MNKTKVPREFWIDENKSMDGDVCGPWGSHWTPEQTTGVIHVREVLPETEEFPEAEFREWAVKAFGRLDFRDSETARWAWNKAKGKT